MFKCKSVGRKKILWKPSAGQWNHFILIDLQKCCKTSCLYTSIIFNKNIKAHKKYTFEIFFKHIGQFPDTKGRSQFIFALLDTCNFERECPLCSKHYLDVLQHTLRGCTKARQIRLLLQNETGIIQYSEWCKFSR